MDNERSANINIGGTEYELDLTTRATKEIAKRYGGLENLGDKLIKSENFEMALDEIILLITLLANQSILIYNLKHKDQPKDVLSEYEVELLTSTLELGGYKAASSSDVQGLGAEHWERRKPKKRRSRISDEESFTRLLYYGTVHLGRSENETWLTPIGLLLDLWEYHKQYNGLATPKRKYYIDNVIPLESKGIITL